jgi:predicted enzyme related to lactoylglutathione lyase
VNNSPPPHPRVASSARLMARSCGIMNTTLSLRPSSVRRGPRPPDSCVTIQHALASLFRFLARRCALGETALSRPRVARVSKSEVRMTGDRRLVAVILGVSDLEKSVALYRDGFGLDLHPGDNAVEDRWIGGIHAEISWTRGAYLHFALYPAKGRPTTGVQISLAVDNIGDAHSAALRGGARVLHEPRKEPWGRGARYEDHDGNIVELTQHN